MQSMTESAPRLSAAERVEAVLGLMAGLDDALRERAGIEMVEVTAERLVATMPVAGNTQPFGHLHGGASVVLAETLGSIGTAIHGYPDAYGVGVDVNATHHRAVSSGFVTGTATPIHLGRRMASWEILIVDDQGRRACTSRITCAVVPFRP